VSSIYIVFGVSHFTPLSEIGYLWSTYTTKRSLRSYGYRA